MSRRVSRVYCALLYLLVASARRRDREELLAAFLACRERERVRLGASGSGYAWLRAAGDIFAAAIALRGDASAPVESPHCVSSQPRGETLCCARACDWPADRIPPTRLMSTLLFEASPTDPVTFTAVTALSLNEPGSRDGVADLQSIDDVHAANDAAEGGEIAFVVRLRRGSERVAWAAGIEAC